jgi:predicted nucleotidyltransferase
MKDVLFKKVKEVVKNIEPSAEVILYGSRARTDFSENSDWDFLILVDGHVDVIRTDRIRTVLYDIELKYKKIISSIVRSRQEWNGPKYKFAPLHVNIERDGVQL